MNTTAKQDAAAPAAPPADGGTAEDRDDVLFAFHRYVDNPTPFEVTWWTRHFPQFADDIRGHAVEVIDMNARVEASTPAGAAGDLHGRAWVAAEYRVTGSPHEHTEADALAMARYILSGPAPATRPASPAPAASAEIEYALAYVEDAARITLLEEGSGTKELRKQIKILREAALAPAAQVNPGRSDLSVIVDTIGAWATRLAKHGMTYQAGPDDLARLADAILAARPVAEGDAGETR